LKVSDNSVHDMWEKFKLIKVIMYDGTNNSFPQIPQLDTMVKQGMQKKNSNLFQVILSP